MVILILLRYNHLHKQKYVININIGYELYKNRHRYQGNAIACAATNMESRSDTLGTCQSHERRLIFLAAKSRFYGYK